MVIDQVTNAGAVPTLEMVIRFAGARQRQIAHNVANITTPGFKPIDANIGEFQATLRDAIRERRGRTGGLHGDLDWTPTRQLRRGAAGELVVEPTEGTDGLVFQDHGQRDLERLMQSVAENSAAFRIATDLLRQQSAMMRGAMSERV